MLPHGQGVFLKPVRRYNGSGMIERVEAIYESGVLRPLAPLNLAESQRVYLTISDPEAEPVRPWAGCAAVDHEFMEQMRAKAAKLVNVPSIEEIQRIMSKIPGSMSDAVVAERDDR